MLWPLHMAKDNFASLMEGTAQRGAAPLRVRAGLTLDVTVLQLGSEFVYVSAGLPSDGRIPRAELLDENGALRVSVGQKIRATCVEPRQDGPVFRAILETAAPNPTGPKADEVLTGKVTRVEKFGVFVATDKGDGLIPLSELGLPPGADHRRLFPVGHSLTVVELDASQPRRLRFSATRVARVEEERNYREFSSGKAAPEPAAQQLGSLGLLLQKKLKSQPLASAPAAKPAPPAQQPPRQPPTKQAGPPQPGKPPAGAGRNR